MTQADEHWLDALAGARDATDARQRREHEALRRAARALDAAPVDELAEQRLLRRLEQEGLLQPKHVRARLGMRHLARTAVVLLCFGLTLEWLVFTPPPADQAAEAPQPRPAAAMPPAPEASKSAPPTSLYLRRQAPQSGQGEAAADRMAPEARQSAPLAEPAAVPLRRLEVEDPAAARRDLLALLDATPGIQWQADEGRDEVLRIRCADASSCEGLNRWLRERELTPRFSPGQPLRLQLVAAE